jgi:anti-sigma B factor antagonist
MSDFTVRTVTGGGAATMFLSGEADLAVADDIQQQGSELLADEGIRSLALDLGEVTFIDSTTLGALIQLRNIAVDANKKLALSRVPSRVQRVMHIAGLTGIFDDADE